MRFVILIDVESNDIKEGYKELDKIMHNEIKPNKISWESTDEAFDNDGEIEFVTFYIK